MMRQNIKKQMEKWPSTDKVSGSFLGNKTIEYINTDSKLKDDLIEHEYMTISNNGDGESGFIMIWTAWLPKALFSRSLEK